MTTFMPFPSPRNVWPSRASLMADLALMGFDPGDLVITDYDGGRLSPIREMFCLDDPHGVTPLLQGYIGELG
jgi:hypothetical protein